MMVNDLEHPKSVIYTEIGRKEFSKVHRNIGTLWGIIVNVQDTFQP